jgi:LmbE family N-acetylglucosaminyl deacetylase
MTMALAGVRRALAVVAHPDDESFGLGALLDHLVHAGVEVSVLCFTHGEASTLHGRDGDLSVVRAAELEAAAGILSVAHTRLLDYPDGGLARMAVSELAAEVLTFAADVDPTHLVAFDVGGVTGHADHVRATEAAMTAGAVLELPVIGWVVPADVARVLNAELGTSFLGRAEDEIDWTIRVDRTRQWRAIAAHRSQSTDNPVLRRRLELLGDAEHARILRTAAGRKG